MKKVSFLCLFLLAGALLCQPAHGQIFSKDAFKANRKWSLGASASYLNFDGKGTLAAGYNCRINWMFFQMMGSTGSHEHDVEYDKWSERTGAAFHVGFQMPITRNIRLIPLLGYAFMSTTDTDGTDWSYSHGQIHNKVSVGVDKSDIDYGGMLSIGFARRWSLYGIYTTHTMGLGISYQFGKWVE